jgi:hypothetical protein
MLVAVCDQFFGNIHISPAEDGDTPFSFPIQRGSPFPFHRVKGRTLPVGEEALKLQTLQFFLPRLSLLLCPA